SSQISREMLAIGNPRHAGAGSALPALLVVHSCRTSPEDATQNPHKGTSFRDKFHINVPLQDGNVSICGKTHACLCLPPGTRRSGVRLRRPWIAGQEAWMKPAKAT